MTKKPELILIKTTPRDANIPMESLDDFKQWVLNENLKPSIALKKLIDKYNCPDIHDSTIISLLRQTYPGVNLSENGLRFNITDSAYPNHQDQFSDKDLDDGIDELLSLPPI